MEMSHNLEVLKLLHSICQEVQGQAKVHSAVAEAKHLLNPEHKVDCHETRFCHVWLESKEMFITLGLYEKFLTCLIEQMPSLSIQDSKLSLREVFLQGPVYIALPALLLGLNTNLELSIGKECVVILEKMFASEHHWQKTFDILVQISHTDKEHFIQSLCNIPDHVANRFGGDAPFCFHKTSYISNLAKSLAFWMANNCSILGCQRAVSISELFSKLCLLGHGSDMWRAVMSQLQAFKDLEWCETFTARVPARSLEAYIIPMLRICHTHSEVSRWLGDLILESRQLQHLLCEKIPMHKCFVDNGVQILRNVIGYTASSSRRLPLFQSLFLNLLSIWSDASNLRHVSYDQYFYICKAIVVCTGFLTNETKEHLSHLLVQHLMTGLQNHLASSDLSLRRTGMAVAEIVAGQLNINAQHKLEFEYDNKQELEELMSVLNGTEEGKEYRSAAVDACLALPQGAVSVDIQVSSENTLDSDDDSATCDELDPLDSVADTPKYSVNPPLYLRECMHGLMNADSPEVMETCLCHASDLVLKNEAMVPEVAVEFAKILLNLTDDFNLEKFCVMRHAAMVSLLLTEPNLTASFLIKQFYDKNINVRQRLDILEALSAASCELAKPPSLPSSKICDPQPVSQQTDKEISWQNTVEKRLALKTRRFSSSIKQVELHFANRFSDVAGFFLFPLLQNAVNPACGFDLFQSDSIVVVKFIYTVGDIVVASRNSPVCVKIVATVLQFLWAIRCNNDTSVKRAAIFALAMAILSLHPSILMFHFEQEVLDNMKWLESLISEEANTDCQIFAARTLNLMYSTFKHHLNA